MSRSPTCSSSPPSPCSPRWWLGTSRGCASRRSCSRSSAASSSGRRCSAGCTSTCRCRSSPCSAWRSCCSSPGWRSTCIASGGGCSATPFSATSLGLVVPVLKDAGQVDSDVGQSALAAASIADFAAIVLLSLFFSSGGSTGSKVVVLGAFAGLVVATGLAVSGAARSMRLGQVLLRLQDTTAEIRVRFAVLLLVAFTALAEKFGLESILGAFLAGAIIGLVDRDSASHPRFRTKLEAIGYGFVVPVFFVSSGIRLDLTGLLHSPSALVRVPVFLLALLVVRGLPALLRLRVNGLKPTLALGFLQATSLPFIVAATQIGVMLGKITPVTAAALVCAGLLSVLIFPALALTLLRRGEPEPAAGEEAPVPEPHLM